MAILSVKYPIIFTGSSSGFEYTIYEGSGESGNVVYRGRSYDTEVDISPVLQRFMNSDLVEVENVDLNTRDYNFSYELDSVVKTFTVSDGTMSQSFTVANDYNDKYILSYDSDYITSKSITGKYHPDSLIFIDVNSPNKTAVIASNVLPGSLTGFGSAHVTVKQNDVRGDGSIVEEIIASPINYSYSLNFIVSNGQRYVTGGTIASSSANYIWSASELSSWTNYGNLANGGSNNGIFANNIFLVVRQQNSLGFVYYSANGTSWSGSYTVNNPLLDITYNGANFIACGGSNTGSTIAYSPDGIVWAQQTPSGDVGLVSKSITSNGTGTTVIASTSRENDNEISYTTNTNGVSGYVRGSGLSLNFICNRVRWINNQFIAVGILGSFAFGYYSTNGVSWQSINANNFTTEYTAVAYGNGVYMFTAKNGSVYYGDSLTGQLTILALSTTALNDVIWNGDKFVVVGQGNRIWTVQIKESEINTITVNGEEFPINYSKGCENFSLYWDNMLGGRSQLLLEGKHNSTYNNDWNRFKTNYDRTVPESFEHRTISNLVTRSWTLYTGILNDFQSEELRDLFNSPKVWLHDHMEERIYSVVITDSAKRMKTQDVDHIYQYEINVDEAQTHIRR